MDRQRLYGLSISSEIPLHQNRADSEAGPADVVIRLGDSVEPVDGVPPGRPVLDFVEQGRRWYAAAQREDGGYELVFHGACTFSLSSDLQTVVARPTSGARDGLIEVLTAGALLAFQLYARGHTVLHGSAVQWGDASIAFVGPSGQGKSTMATLQCADGARLITDDVLRVDLDDAIPRVRLGATELRLRKGADELSARFRENPVSQRTSPDDRQVLRLEDGADDLLPLRGIVIPVPDRSGGDFSLQRLPPRDAIYALLNFGRLNGWLDQQIVSQHFAQLTETLTHVPVFVARAPWGPPFADDLAERIRDGVLAAS